MVAGSMDIVIEDAGSHPRSLQEPLFALYWPLLKPGGYYIMEDVDPQKGGDAYALDHSALAQPLRSALEQNHAFLVNTMVGVNDEEWRAWCGLGERADGFL